MTAYALLAFMLLLAAAHLVTRPFLLPEPDGPGTEPEKPAMAVEKDRLVEAIRDLDMDFATGKLGEADYRRLRARDTAEAARILQALAEQAAAEPSPPEPVAAEPPPPEPAGSVPALAFERELDPGLDEELERRIAARRAALVGGEQRA